MAKTVENLFDENVFPRSHGYLAACVAGLPPHAVSAAVHEHLELWQRGRLDSEWLSEEVETMRALYARLAGVTVGEVGCASHVSQLVSIVATVVPDGGEVLAVAGDFSSLTHPFEQLSARGVRVRYVPVAELAESVDENTDLVVFSLVQSATGEVADHERICAAAARYGAYTLADLTQSLGWLAVGARDFDFTVCHAYKWLCSPRGTAFLTVRQGLEGKLTPLAAGWCSATSVWESCYAGHTPLAPNAGRFDLSPVWPSISGTVRALELFNSLDAVRVQEYCLELANMARDAVGLTRYGSAIVAWPDPTGAYVRALRDAGIAVSGRAGNARIACHIWNGEQDIELLREALNPGSRGHA